VDHFPEGILIGAAVGRSPYPRPPAVMRQSRGEEERLCDEVMRQSCGEEERLRSGTGVWL
jgi:hypothetical protein